MDLFIETLTGTAFELRVSPNDTVMSIKSKIQRVEGIPVGQQHLIWQNDELSDQQSLRDYSIPGGATLRLVLGLRGGPMNAYRAPTIRLTPIHFVPPPISTLERIASPSSAASHVARSIAVMSSSTTSSTTTSSATAKLSAMTAVKREKEMASSKPETKGEASAVENPMPDPDITDKICRQKHITFFIVKDGDSLDLRVLERNQSTEPGHSSKEYGHCPTSSDECRVNPIEKHQHLVNSQSLPFLQSEPSTTLEVEQKLSQPKSTNLKATSSSSSSSSSAAALLAGLLYAAGSCGRDSSPEGCGDDGGLSSDDERFPCTPATAFASSYWPRPPSLEWDYGPVRDSGGICGEDEFPLYDDDNEVPGSGVGCDGCLDEEDEEDDDDDDSLADLEDYFLYYRTGDVLFGPSTRNSILRNSLLHGIDVPVLPKSTRTPTMKREERSNLVEKVKNIKAQLSQASQHRAQRRQRIASGCPTAEVVENKKPEISQRIPAELPEEVYKTSPSPRQKTSTEPKDLPSSLTPPWPPRRSITRPYTSSVDLHRLPLPAATTSSLEAEDALSVSAAARQLQRPFADPIIRPRGTAPARTNGFEVGILKPRLFPPSGPLPGVSCFSRSLLGSAGSNSGGGNLRQRRFGTVQAPDITKIGDSLFPPLFASPPLHNTLAATASSLDSAAVERLKLTEEINSRRRRSTRVTPEEFHLPPLSPKQPLPSDLPVCTNIVPKRTSRPSTRCLNDRKLTSMVVGRSRQDVSEPPPVIATPSSSNRKSPKLKGDRCASCNRKTGLANSYTCRCEQTFCARHRYAELHACSFDYKAEARRCLRESNPVITAAKLPKI